MKPLATTQLMMTWLSMCPTEVSTTSRQRNCHIAHTATVLILVVSCFSASLAYCLKYILIDFNSATFAFMIVIGDFGLIYFMITAILMRHQIGDIFTRLTTIYESNENTEEFQYLAQANNTSKSMWTIYFIYMANVLASQVLTSALSVLYCYWTQGDFNVVDLYRPGKYVLPWNQSTPAGYFTEMCVSIPMSYVYLILTGIPLLLFISLCIHHQAFYEMFKYSIDKSVQCDAKLLCDLIRFHISAKDWFLKSANVYNSFVLVQLISGTVMLTISIFYLDLQWQQFDLIVASIIATTFIGMSTLLIYCYYGKLTTESYEMMAEYLFDMNWYKQPIELQKYFILMIANMQKSLYYHGFEVAKLNLETFVNLLKKVLAYYVAIKTIASK